MQIHRNNMKTHCNNMQTHSNNMQTHSNNMQIHRNNMKTYRNNMQTHSNNMQTHSNNMQTRIDIVYVQKGNHCVKRLWICFKIIIQTVSIKILRTRFKLSVLNLNKEFIIPTVSQRPEGSVDVVVRGGV